MLSDDTQDEVVEKGLRAGSVSLLGSVVIGVAAVAPANTSTGTLGPAAAAVGVHLPGIILLGAVPMLLVALGYRELNRAMPDAGTSFTWVASAFGPRLGWLAGWTLAAAMALGYCNAASFGAAFVFVALGQLFDAPWLAGYGQVPAINLLTCGAIIGACGWVAYRGMATTQRVQLVLVGGQLGVLALFLACLFAGAPGPLHQPVRPDWFNPLPALSATGLATGLSMVVFMFWGWETTLTLSEETEGAHQTPGLAAWLTVGATVILFVLIAMACIRYAGVGQTGLGLASPQVRTNVFLPLAEPVLGRFAVLLWIAIVFSAVACVQSTINCPSRTFLAMGFYGALPAGLGQSSRHGTPGMAILASTLGAWLVYAVISLASQNLLSDTVTALSILVCFYLSLTSLACVWYFRRQWFSSVPAFLLRLLAPLTGGVTLGWLFVNMIRDSMDPAYGSGSHIGPVGLVAIMGTGIIALGAVIMMLVNWRMPAYFRGATVPVHAAGQPLHAHGTAPSPPLSQSPAASER